MPETKNSDYVGHFLSHVPNAGGTFMLASINTLVSGTKEWKSLPNSQKFGACNVGFDLVNAFRRKHPRKNGRTCTLWTSERGYSSIPASIYTIVRELRELVLSEYFHCEKTPGRIPSLDSWLDIWANRYIMRLGCRKQQRLLATTR